MIVLDKTKDNEIAICLSEKADAYSKIVIKLEKTGSSNVVTLGYHDLDDVVISERCWVFGASAASISTLENGDLIYSVFGTTGSFTYATGSSSIDTSNMTLLEKGKAFIKVTEPIVSTYSPDAIEYVTYKPEN